MGQYILSLGASDATQMAHYKLTIIIIIIISNASWMACPLLTPFKASPFVSQSTSAANMIGWK